MEAPRPHWHDLIYKYLTDTISKEELQELESQLAASALKRAEFEVLVYYYPDPPGADGAFDKADSWKRIAAALPAPPSPKRGFWQMPVVRWLAAAIIAGTAAIAVFWLLRQSSAEGPSAPKLAIAPGTVTVEKANTCDTCVFLLLPGGNRLNLNNDTDISRLPSGWKPGREPAMIRYAGDTLGTSAHNYIIDNPGRESYTVELPDASRIVLRGGSRLLVPVRFSRDQRDVQLDGEAFFNIHSDRAHPFRVVTAQGMEAEVLGTRFDFAAYAGEPLHISLVDGAVSVRWKKQLVTLKPGEQAVVDSASTIGINRLSAKALQQVRNWSDDSFEFHNMNITDILRELARQYRMDLHFEGELHGKNNPTARCSKSRQKLRGILANLRIYVPGFKYRVDSSQITIIATH